MDMRILWFPVLVLYLGITIGAVIKFLDYKYSPVTLIIIPIIPVLAFAFSFQAYREYLRESGKKKKLRLFLATIFVVCRFYPIVVAMIGEIADMVVRSWSRTKYITEYANAKFNLRNIFSDWCDANKIYHLG